MVLTGKETDLAQLGQKYVFDYYYQNQSQHHPNINM